MVSIHIYLDLKKSSTEQPPPSPENQGGQGLPPIPERELGEE